MFSKHAARQGAFPSVSSTAGSQQTRRGLIFSITSLWEKPGWIRILVEHSNRSGRGAFQGWGHPKETNAGSRSIISFSLREKPVSIVLILFNLVAAFIQC